MANRPVYVPLNKSPYVNVYMPEFVWNSGFAKSQKQKNITALHNAFNKRFPDKKILEISSKSLQDLGISLSAFNLKKFIPSINKSVSLECTFQGSKVFATGGPYIDLYNVTSLEAKKDIRLKNSGPLKEFSFEGTQIGLVPKTAFYDWLYINALIENPNYIPQLLEYDGFTDIEFNPNKSINCQARAAALFVSLYRLGIIAQCYNFENFLKIIK